ncbi:MAG TPA: YncE family protein [Bacteroidia bacterium]|jgi:YVTN family beta-propeller protein|nr:YncE family protein [Bacteroidia bacterium]
MKKIKLIIALITFVISANAQTSNGQYKVTKKIAVAGDGGWDFLTVDEPSQHLFLSHGTVVDVVDLKTDKTIFTIPDTKGVHGITIANDLNKGFISNGKDTSITVFDLKTFATLEKVKIKGISPDAILYDEFSHRVFSFNARSNDATILDAKTNKIIETIKFEGNPEVAVTDGKGTIYVNIEDKSTVVVIDAMALKIKNVWSLAPGEEPTGLALDNKTHRLFSGCANKLMVVMNAENGKVISTLPIGEGCDGVAFDPEKKCAYSTNGEGSITVVKEENENTFKVLETVTTQKGAKTIALSTTTHQIFSTTAEFGERPEPTKENPRPRAKIKPNSFVVLVVEDSKGSK